MPVIVNAVLNEHQIVVDIVAFVNRGDFPRSRLGEKQRGKILAGWVSRKLRTMAQFSIKDGDVREIGVGQPGAPASAGGEAGSGGAGPDEGVHRASVGTGSLRSSSLGGARRNSSLRNLEPAPQIAEQVEPGNAHQQQQYSGQAYSQATANPSSPSGPIEMPADNRQPRLPQLDGPADQTQGQALPNLPSHGFELPDFDQFGLDDGEGERPDSKHSASTNKTAGAGIGGAMSSKQNDQQQQQQRPPPQIRLPGVDGRESYVGDDDDWTKDAYMSMNLAGTLSGR